MISIGNLPLPDLFLFSFPEQSDWRQMDYKRVNEQKWEIYVKESTAEKGVGVMAS